MKKKSQNVDRGGDDWARIKPYKNSNTQGVDASGNTRLAKNELSRISEPKRDPGDSQG